MPLTITGPEGLSVEIKEDGEYAMFRNGRNDTIVISGSSLKKPEQIAEPHTNISRKHLRIEITDIVKLTDLESKNGSSLDEEMFGQTEIDMGGEYLLGLGSVKFNLAYQR